MSSQKESNGIETPHVELSDGESVELVDDVHVPSVDGSAKKRKNSSEVHLHFVEVDGMYKGNMVKKQQCIHCRRSYVKCNSDTTSSLKRHLEDCAYFKKSKVDDIEVQVETIEGRLQSFLTQLQSEVGVLDRIVHKNKNQHRRSSYFQYLLKVRRDCMLLQSTNLVELVNSCFLVINGNRPKQKVQLLESLKRRKCDGGKHNFLMRLQGATRLLSQMVEPMLKAAIEISTLLARSFFMGFSMTVLALLARLRVLTQQILVDIVSVFNMVSSLSQKQQSIKINQEGIQVFREYYPTNEQVVFLECVWETDKFVLVERKSEPENKNPKTVKDDVICQGLSTVEYQSIETVLGDNKPVDIIMDKTFEEDPATINRFNDCKQLNDQDDIKDHSGVLHPSIKILEHEQISCLSLPAHQDPPEPKPQPKKKVAFITVNIPEPSKANESRLPINLDGRVNGEKEDRFYSLLTGGI